MDTTHDHTHTESHCLDQEKKEILPWEKRCHALLDVLEYKNVVPLEDKLLQLAKFSPGMITGQAYYERWILSATQILIEKNIFTTDEIAKKTNEIALRSLQEW